MSRQNRSPVPGGFYKHFKGKLYQVMAVATHSETREEMVVYQALYGTFKVYVRPLGQFMSEVDREKYPEVKQKYRFERIEFVQAKENEKKESIKDSIIEEVIQPEVSEGSAEAELIQFLDADTCKEKLNILLGIKNHLTNHMINSMMVSMDLPIPEGSMEEHFDMLKDYLHTRIRFESNRLR